MIYLCTILFLWHKLINTSIVSTLFGEIGLVSFTIVLFEFRNSGAEKAEPLNILVKVTLLSLLTFLIILIMNFCNCNG